MRYFSNSRLPGLLKVSTVVVAALASMVSVSAHAQNYPGGVTTDTRYPSANYAYPNYATSPAGSVDSNKSLIVNQVGNKAYGPTSIGSATQSPAGQSPVGERYQRVLVTSTPVGRVGGCDSGLRLATLAQKWWCPPDTDPDTVVSLSMATYVNCVNYIGQFGIRPGSTGMFKIVAENNPKNAGFGRSIAADTSSCTSGPSSQ